jgi:membrane associated rhomboid family serine protease
VIPLRDNVPTRTFPVVTVGLIVANAIVWFWELSKPGVDYHVAKDGYYPCTVQGPCEAIEVAGTTFTHHLTWWQGVFTSMFMHASWIHILGNMLFLWIFGNNVEDALGRFRFLLWYLAAGVAAAALQTLVTLHFGTTEDASVPNIGASGAIAGVLGAYFVLLPRARVLTAIFFGLIFLREIPAVWFLGIWIGFQALTGSLGLTHPDQTGGVAVFAHIGGFAFGLLTIRLVAKRRPLQPTY